MANNSILDVFDSVETGKKLGRLIGELAFRSEHEKDLNKAIALYNTIDRDDIESLNKVLEYLEPVDVTDKSYIFALACYFRALCYFHLDDQRKARYQINFLMNIETNPLTLNKSIIEETVEDSLIILKGSICRDLLKLYETYDDVDADICWTISEIVVEELSFHCEYLKDVRTIKELDAKSFEIPRILSAFEDAFNISINDEHLIGVSREALIEDYDEKVSFRDFSLVDLALDIKRVQSQ